MLTETIWWLLGLQVALGAFDVGYNHEMAERLVWRPEQARELGLHAVRNVLYTMLFIILAWMEPLGLIAWLVIFLLLAELVTTLIDFVEEDRSRQLPPLERVTHTLLAVNFGAFLALILPVLIQNVGRPTAIMFTSYGLLSIALTVVAAVVGAFAIRDALAARRAKLLVTTPAAPLARDLPVNQHILVTGGTGFIGRRLVSALTEAGHRVTVLSRKPRPTQGPLRTITSLDEIAADTWINAIINLAGEPIADGLWTRRKREQILQSRLATTADVVALIARLQFKPEVLISGSAVGWYGPQGDDRLTEQSAGKESFSRHICKEWEAAAMAAKQHSVRVVLLRIGLVLGRDGGMLGRMLLPFEFALGGPLGNGRQWMSWIERDDLIRAIAFLLARTDLSGPFNATAPRPVRNEAFTNELARSLNRPALFRAPARLLSLVGGDMADELLLAGQRVIPERLLEAGFVFHFTELERAFGDILGRLRREQA